MKPIHIPLLALLMACATAQAATPKDAAARAHANGNANTNVNADAGENAPGRAASDDEELQIAALEGLMAQPAERSLPILRKVLAGAHSVTVKRRALFVLSQVNAPEARELLLQTARSNPQLRGDAVRSIGISGDTKALDALQDIYKDSDEQNKKHILQAWMIAGRKEMVYQVAANATDEKEASEAIRMLGVMGAREELRKLGDRARPSSGLLDAYAISGDLEGLRKIADTSPDPAMRVDAVRRIGIVHNDAARAALRDIYGKSTDAKIKDAALQGMLIAQDDQGVLALYKAAKTTDEKRTLLRTLSMMNGDAAIEAIDATLEKKP